MLPVAAAPSHIERNASASLFRDATKADDAADALPRMLQRYRSPQSDSDFAQLPHELEALILSALSGDAQSGSPLLRLGLTCNYWHLRVRHHIEDTSEGRRFRMDFEFNRYAACYGLTPVQHAKEKIGWRSAEQLERWARNWAAGDGTDIHDPYLRQREPATVAVDADLRWSPEFGQILARRAGFLTVFDFSAKINDAEFLIQSISVTQRGSYLALVMGPENYALQDAREIAKEMAAHPVVCFVKIAEDSFRPAAKKIEFGLNLLTACAEHAVDSCQFSLMYDVLNKEKAGQLADVIRKFKCGVTIEISANKVEPECMALILDAVRLCNRSASTPLSLHCKGREIAKAVGLAYKTTLEQNGVHVQYLNEILHASDAAVLDESGSSDQEFGALLSQLDLSADGTELEGGSDSDDH